MTKIFTLSSKERLKSRKRIEELFSGGKKFNTGPFRVFYILNSAAKSSLQLGVGVSTRNFKKAVDRNRVKRLTRECWRLQKNILVDSVAGRGLQLDVFIIYTAKTIPVFGETSAFMTSILDKLLKQTSG